MTRRTRMVLTTGLLTNMTTHTEIISSPSQVLSHQAQSHTSRRWWYQHSWCLISSRWAPIHLGWYWEPRTRLSWKMMNVGQWRYDHGVWAQDPITTSEAGEDNCINNDNRPSGLYYTLQMLRSLINMFTLQNISINLPRRRRGMSGNFPLIDLDLLCINPYPYFVLSLGFLLCPLSSISPLC